MMQAPFSTPEIAGDGIDAYLIAEGTFRLTFVHGTELVNRMRANHRLGPGGTLILGHAYLLTLLAAGTMKNEERIGLSVECDGPVEGLSVEAVAGGRVRGYLKNNEVDIVTAGDSHRLFGTGTITMLRYADEMRYPAQGQIAIRPGTLAENVALYYAHSEQTATFLDINVHFDDTRHVVGAAGIMVQALPGASVSTIDRIAEKLETVRPLGRHFSEGATGADIVRRHLAPWEPQLIATRPAEFYCGCSKERFSRFLAALPQEERDDILAVGPIPLKTTCHNCNTTYTFGRDELETLFSPAATD
ncbi:MAG: Hsp33 family molecular chaperone HslO [Spirochaeta sp.]|jgi:molecular chaperone Hsp33|nr:Hsp33 family molecular chaperone HslO [Spirochaeta sp.]